MRTTIELPDDLAIEAKKLAAELRVPLRALIEEGLRARLRGELSPSRPKKTKAKAINWVTVDGDLPEELDLKDREKMHAWLGQAEP